MRSSEPLLSRPRTCGSCSCTGLPLQSGLSVCIWGVELGPTAPGSARWAPWWHPGLDLGLWVSRGGLCSHPPPPPPPPVCTVREPAEISVWAAVGGSGGLSLLRAGASLAGEMATQCPRASRTVQGQKPTSSSAFIASAAPPRQPVCGGSALGWGVCAWCRVPGCREWAVLAPYPPVVQTWVLPLSRPSGLLERPHTPTKAMSWKSSRGRGQEVTRWGPGQGQADIGRRLVQGVARHRGQRIHTGPRGQQEELLPELVSGPLPHVPEPLLPLSWCPVVGAWPDRLGRGAGTLRLGRWLPVTPGLPNKEQLLRSGGGGGGGLPRVQPGADQLPKNNPNPQMHVHEQAPGTGLTHCGPEALTQLSHHLWGRTTRGPGQNGEAGGLNQRICPLRLWAAHLRQLGEARPRARGPVEPISC